MDERVGWVGPEPRRSTWDIIWSCLAIFLVCSWKCTHLNIPTREESQAGWYHPSWKPIPILYWPERPLMRKWARKAMWMVIIAVAPEVGAALAMQQNLEAKDALKRLHLGEEAAGHGHSNSSQWTMAHAFYAGMGGFVLRIPKLAPQRGNQGNLVATAAPTERRAEAWREGTTMHTGIQTEKARNEATQRGPKAEPASVITGEHYEAFLSLSSLRRSSPHSKLCSDNRSTIWAYSLNIIANMVPNASPR